MPQQTTATSPVSVGKVQIGPGCRLALIAGPCVIESRDHTLRLAEQIQGVADELEVPLIFKASYDKANRSSVRSFRGPGIDAGLAILSDVHMSLGVPVVSDIHDPGHAEAAAKVLDMIQIPAFLCRQTDLVTAAAQTHRPVNVKKGQFMSPHEMRLVVDKIRETGNEQILLTERGTFFGYGRLVNDMTAIPLMSRLAPVIFDATHSCQLPGQGGEVTGGQREMAPYLARAAVAAGAHALFLEVHDRPDKAKSDANTVWPLDRLAELLRGCLRIHEALNAAD
ncbi:MAG TPA: 3-deoxy-8-phosphooctulonate synthase [Phycisphaerae bacterium]|nr:3-deoxy-8-phosphooctulonate synthase [Phycisphaerae bacterium]HOJ73758.1 3-deoxy-8-phosphooctulonate synthase [Phycisphaerae bacterium]HOM50405.1 3-deoxy-8-phosphooctulonate synthase [Phycisphaerae bacterium]HON65691.1 3-deoxy-8-phosphooctulonate synthase [Phycisphaerae bacterium]HOQ84183.1 3-deoxy-8-phosphooctulonate synthase [Phycisphaerae bacterium]